MSRIFNLPPKVGELASKITAGDQGPFPLFHVDLGHNNIVVDDNYNVIGVIDWEHTCSVPWELIYFPWSLSTVPAPMALDSYDERGVPKDRNTSTMIRAEKLHPYRAVYRTKQSAVTILVRYPGKLGKRGPGLRVKLYAEDGICGRYADVLRVYQDTWSGRERVSDFDGAGDSKGFRGGAH